MKKIVVFGNCQAGQMALLMSHFLPQNEYEIINLSNNSRTGDMLLGEEILNIIRLADILVYQPLSSKHNELSDENIKKNIKHKSVSLTFPYIFNSGIYSMSHAPMAEGNSYGKIYGEEAIISLIQKQHTKNEILEKYMSGHIDFDLQNRFQESIDILVQKEYETDIKISDFIEQNYKKEKLFITHNHPTNIVFYEIIKKIFTILEIPFDQSKIKNCRVNDLFETNCPITPYDIESHGYQFVHHNNWLEKGIKLIDLIWSEHAQLDAEKVKH
ncbi:WcbI family polysaccharide biosynthesis putative acetyltransferase [Sulfurimonas sp. HSL-1716]|uniref:WcbI family polysaccharide biosynthesis putative acetyltransferase n=1 Tax=Hydrocurvibacter sulfurireducens TaxID=3131937 RepID=UPI0031F73A66